VEQADVPVTHKDPIHAITYNQNFKQLITCSDGSVCLIQFEIVVVVVVAAAATTTIAVIIIVVVVIIIIITVVILISVTDGRTDRVTTAKACV